MRRHGLLAAGTRFAIVSINMRFGKSRTIFATLLFAAMIVSIADSVVLAAPDPELLVLARGEFSDLTMAELALLKFAGSDSSDPEGFAAAGPSAKLDDPPTIPRMPTSGARSVRFAPN
jgi:hypothetical protein